MHQALRRTDPTARSMTPKQTVKHGRTVWTIDARSQGCGRLFADSKDAVQRKLRERLAGIDHIEFTDQDRLAKQELGDRGTMLEAVRYFLARPQSAKKRTLSEAGAKWLLEIESARVTKAYRDTAEVVLNHLYTYVGADYPVNDVIAEHIKRFLGSNPNWKPGTRNTMRSRLSSFFYWCVADGCCAVHPIANRQVRAVKDRRDKPPAIFSVEQAHRLLDTAHVLLPQMIPYLVLGMFCGIRPDKGGEMGKLKAEDINLDEGYISVPASKSERRTVELSENARAWLRLAPTLDVVNSRRYRRKLCELAHVSWSPDVMRHTFASYHVKHHQHAGKTAEMMGHEQSLKMLFKHYVAPVTKDDAAAFWKIEPVTFLTVVRAAAVNE